MFFRHSTRVSPLYRGPAEQWPISKNQLHSAISAPIGLKLCTPLEGDNTQNHTQANFEFRPLQNLVPLWILCLHYGQWDDKFQIDILKSFFKHFGLIFSHTPAWRGRSLFKLLPLWEILVTRFFSIFVWRILWNFGNLTPYGTEGDWRITTNIRTLGEGIHLYKPWKFHGSRSTNFWENAIQTCTQKVWT